MRLSRFLVPMSVLPIRLRFIAGLAPLAVLAVGLLLPSSSEGQTTFRLLYSFAGGTDGANPAAGLLLGPTGTLYGTTAYGGISNVGTIFKLDNAGKETILHTFSGGNDGAISYADLIRDQAGHLYGTTLKGGPSNLGTVFELVSLHKEVILHTSPERMASIHTGA